METHGRQVAISRDIVALDRLTSLRVLRRQEQLATSRDGRGVYLCSGWASSKLVLLKSAYLIVAGSHKSIVAQVPADIGRDDFTVDAITGHEILVHASRGSRHGEQLARSGLGGRGNSKGKANERRQRGRRREREERERDRERKRGKERERGKTEQLRAGPLAKWKAANSRATDGGMEDAATGGQGVGCSQARKRRIVEREEERRGGKGDSDSDSSPGLLLEKRRMIWCEWWGGAVRSIERRW